MDKLMERRKKQSTGEKDKQKVTKQCQCNILWIEV